MKTVISSHDRSFLDFSELKRFGSLLRYLSLRDVMVRYKQTWMGFGWSIVRPAINILIFGSLSYLVEKGDDFTLRFIAVSAGIVFWQLISTTVTEVSNSLLSNAGILTKVYFPKILLPIASLLVCFLDFLIAFLLFLPFYLIWNGLPGLHLLFLPLVLLLGTILSLGLGLFAASGSVKYRDVRLILPFLLQVLFYASPVFISSTFILNLGIPEFLKFLYRLNPLVFIIDAYKFSLFGKFENFDPFFAATSLFITFGLFIWSVKAFLKFEKSFADHI